MREYIISFRLLLVGVLKRVYFLFPSVLSDPYDILERWFNIMIEPPSWLFPLLISLGMTIAVSLAYHEIRMEKIRTENALAVASKDTSIPIGKPKSRLSFYDRQAIHEVEIYMNENHGHADTRTLESDVLNGWFTGQLLKGDCSLCGKPRKGKGRNE